MTATIAQRGEGSRPCIGSLARRAALVVKNAKSSAKTANIAVLIATPNANFRIICSYGRERLLPAVLGRSHRKSQTLHIAIIAYSLVSAIFTLVFGTLYVDVLWVKGEAWRRRRCRAWWKTTKMKRDTI